jgi:hypothetical protein
MTNKLPISHNAYMKLFHINLTKGVYKFQKDTSLHLDILLVDEWQDANPVTIEVVKLLPARKKVVVGDCLDGKTRVKTSDGWKTIASIYKQFNRGVNLKAYSYNEQTNEYEYRDIISATRKEYTADTVKISTLVGNVTSTYDHRYLTVDGYKRANELTTEDILVVTDVGTSQEYIDANSKEYQLLLGSYLGDGHLSYERDNVFRLALTHSSKQQNYLKWKASFFNREDFLHKIKGGVREIKGKECVVQDSYTCQTKLLITKIPRINLLEALTNLNALGLAIWLMDDGSIKSRSGKSKNVAITISTNTFSYEEHLFIQTTLRDRFGLSCSIGKDRNYYEINFGVKESEKLLGIVKQYIHDDFIGKFKNQKYSYAVEHSKPAYVSKISKIENIPHIKNRNTHYVYDIGVDTNHNFVASNTSQNLDTAQGLVVHNCYQNIYSFNGTVNGFKYLKYPTLHLTKSFRCSTDIADRVQSFMRQYIDPRFIFRGTDSSTIGEDMFYLSRTNSGVIDKMYDLVSRGESFKTTKPIKSYFEYPISILNAIRGTPIYSSQYKWLVNEDMSTILDRYPYDIELKGAMSIINRLGISLYSLYDKVKNMNIDSNLTLSTIHSSKGLERSIVELSHNCILKNPDNYDTIEEYEEEIRLIYVAMSRAKNILIYPI